MIRLTKEPQNCWKFWACPEETKEKCLAYQQNLGWACWTVPYGYDGAPEKKLEQCHRCDWYKKINDLM
jgi:hypothetical protein